MAERFRIATFNVENLFSRPKLLNLDDHEEGDAALSRLRELKAELKGPAYDGPRILALWAELKPYVNVVETRGKLFNRYRTEVVAGGKEDWDGWLDLKRDRFDDSARSNAARVIKEVNADIICLVEVESRPVLHRFGSEKLKWRKDGRKLGYAFDMLVDGNDDRGIDLGLLSRYPIKGMWSHVFDSDGGEPVFARDCIEYQVGHPGGFDIYMVLNHFTSKGYSSRERGNARRKRQAGRVAEILAGKYDLEKDHVAVAGDLNDTPDSAALAPLLQAAGLFDVLEEKIPDPAMRWTYHYKKNEQIDYLLVSKPLKERLLGAGVERRGIFDVEKFSGGGVRQFREITKYKESASDHGAVWAEFLL